MTGLKILDYGKLVGFNHV